MAKEAMSRAKKRALIGALIAVVVGGSVAGGVLLGGSSTPKPQPSPVGSPVPSELATYGVPGDQAGCTKPVEPKYQGRIKFAPGSTHPAYSSDPPTSGWYLPGAHAGYYEIPPSTEEIMAFPANGGTVVWASQAESEVVRTFAVRVKAQDSLFLKYSSLDKGVVFTAWGVMQRCDHFSGAAYLGFYSFYGKSHALKAAEPTAKPEG